jgi:uncharacterized protein (TIGR00369 family)
MPSGAELVTQFVAHSPFGVRAGLSLEHIEPERAVLKLAYSEEVTTFGDVIHGGAIATLADVAATAAAWSAAEVKGAPRGATVGLTVDYLGAARGRDLRAEARVLRRGRSICFCEVDILAGDELVAKALVTYKLG